MHSIENYLKKFIAELYKRGIGGKKWEPVGTGCVLPSMKIQDQYFIQLQSERDGEIFLKVPIQTDGVYLKKEERGIVWIENKTVAYALNFKYEDGRDEIHRKICEIQCRNRSIDELLIEAKYEDLDSDTESASSDEGFSLSSIVLPSCELSNLSNISDLLRSCFPYPSRQKRLAILVNNHNYIQQLIQIFRICEEKRRVDDLDQLRYIFRIFFVLDDCVLLNILLNEDIVVDVIRAIDYSDLLRDNRYSEYMKKQSKLLQILTLDDPELFKIIQLTYQMQCILEIVAEVQTIFEIGLIMALSADIVINKCQVVSIILKDVKFLGELVRKFKEGKDFEERRFIAVLIKESLEVAASMLEPDRTLFHQVLKNQELKLLGVNIFNSLVNFSPSAIREFIMVESKSCNYDQLLIRIAIQVLSEDRDPELEVGVLMVDSLRTLLEENSQLVVGGTSMTEFLRFFYIHCVSDLVAPLVNNVKKRTLLKDDYRRARLLSLILDLMISWVDKHSYHLVSFIIHVNFLSSALVLLKSKHTFLRLSALRLVRQILGQKDEHYNRYIVERDIFRPIVAAFVKNGSRYNLFNSAILELFDFIRKEDIRIVVLYVCKVYFKAFENIQYVKTFQLLKLSVEDPARHALEICRSFGPPRNLRIESGDEGRGGSLSPPPADKQHDKMTLSKYTDSSLPNTAKTGSKLESMTQPDSPRPSGIIRGKRSRACLKSVTDMDTMSAASNKSGAHTSVSSSSLPKTTPASARTTPFIVAKRRRCIKSDKNVSTTSESLSKIFDKAVINVDKSNIDDSDDNAAIVSGIVGPTAALSIKLGHVALDLSAYSKQEDEVSIYANKSPECSSESFVNEAPPAISHLLDDACTCYMDDNNYNDDNDNIDDSNNDDDAIDVERDLSNTSPELVAAKRPRWNI